MLTVCPCGLVYGRGSHDKQLLGIEAGYKASTPQRFIEWISKTIPFYLPAKEADFTLIYLWKKSVSSNDEKFLLYNMILIVSLQEGTGPG